MPDSTFTSILTRVMLRAVVPHLEEQLRRQRAYIIALDGVSQFFGCSYVEFLHKSPAQIDALLDQKVAAMTQPKPEEPSS